jgi:hypothetical protein
VTDTLPLPPDEDSDQAHVKHTWEETRKMILDGVPHETQVQLLETYIIQRQQEVDSNSLPSQFDWGRDLYLARVSHDFWLNWSPRQSKQRSDWHEYWLKLTSQVDQYTDKISQTAFTSTILLHGAVALGAINVLTQKRGELEPYMIPAAKFVLFGALVGISLLIMGQFIIFVYLTQLSGTVRAKITGPYRYKRFYSLSRYWNKYYKPVRIGTYMVYASIFWFIFYGTVAFIILLQN